MRSYNRVFTKKTRTDEWVRRERLQHILLVKYFLLHNLLKALYRSAYIRKKKKVRIMFLLSSLPYNASYSYRNSRCFRTGRVCGVNKSYRTSRLMFKQFVENGHYSGVFKAS